MTEKDVTPGKSYPLGATVYEDGINFSVYSPNAASVELLLFEFEDVRKPSRIIRLDPFKNRTFYYWHAFIKNLKAGQIYAYRVEGPFDPAKGNRFDFTKVLIDPYSKLVATGDFYDRQAAILPGDNCQHAMKSVAIDPSDYLWEGDSPLQNFNTRTVIYELHVKGFTSSHSSKVTPSKRGTYAGVIEKIPYLKSLGITAVELMPIQQFDDQDVQEPLTNYWGYNPTAFFAPHREYSSDKSILGPINEFRDMVKALHKANIEVILDVVFNHTSEGDGKGPTQSLKGFANKSYYMLKEDKRLYANYTGCGNTINANHSITRQLIMSCLKHWVSVMHVDGFRFDLASVLSRDENGIPLKNPPIIWEIESDPVLAGTKIIAEAWDAGGLYQVGSFVGKRWAEWNGKFRDEVRKFLKSDENMATGLAYKIASSPDVYTSRGRNPERNINMITCHDGFTLNDLFSYNLKHNIANCENNNDGTNENYSWNCGVEGETNDPIIEKLRVRQIKNSFVILFFSQGTPLILMGDEMRRTQFGNNNAYCHDDATNYLEWTLEQKNEGLLRFLQKLIHFTNKYKIFHFGKSWLPPNEQLLSHITWHGTKIGKPDLSKESRRLAFSLENPPEKFYSHVMLNSHWEDAAFELPKLAKGWHWYKQIDTFLDSPNDFSEEFNENNIVTDKYFVFSRSIVALFAVCDNK